MRSIQLVDLQGLVTVERSQRAVESRCEKARGWKFIPMVRRSRLRRIFTFLLSNFTGNQTWNGQKVTMSLIPLSANLEKNISFLENHFCQSCLWQSWNGKLIWQSEIDYNAGFGDFFNLLTISSGSGQHRRSKLQSPWICFHSENDWMLSPDEPNGKSRRQWQRWEVFLQCNPRPPGTAG